MEICLITPGPNRTVAPFLHYEGNDSSEITGPVFDPSGSRLYFSSQRGPAPVGTGITFEVTGPFRDRKSTRLTPVTNAHLVCRLLLEKKKYQNPKVKHQNTLNHRTTQI